ncbi:MAG: oligosaccharide flippase family protein [Dyadobacter sp.]|uniref:lipopolysaccharide biosynthesis protein n=1 Tax=Dyadobacter sp. TaxID=1914288 RepID=UPI0032665F9C
MLEIIKSKVIAIIVKKNQRTEKILKNILMSFGVKGGSILVSLILVPLTIDYVSPIQYGIWLTISSIVGWMNFFDIGLGNGLRNSLASSISNGNFTEGKKYVSTTYAALLAISSLLLLVFWISAPLVNWNRLLNVPSDVNDNFTFVILIVLSSFCVQFVVQLINTVLTAVHEPAVAAFISFVGQVGSLIAIFFLKQFIPGTLMLLASILTIIPIITLVLASIYLYGTRLKYLAPSYKGIEVKYVRKIMGTGGIFFIIQIGAIILFQTNNIIITNILGPQYVTEFNVSYKLFSVVTMIFTIIITPYWSAFTDAYAKQDFVWMKKNMTTIRRLSAYLTILLFLVLLLSPWLYKLWLGDAVKISFALSSAMALYSTALIWQTAHVYILNGLSKMRLQLIIVLVSSMINIPLAIQFGKLYGLVGIVSSNAVFSCIMSLVFYVQVEKILNQQAKGIWGK